MMDGHRFLQATSPVGFMAAYCDCGWAGSRPHALDLVSQDEADALLRNDYEKHLHN